jgi:choline dehydrogenase-like flavoprotein
VADASVMPTIPRASTNLSTVALAELLARRIGLSTVALAELLARRIGQL